MKNGKRNLKIQFRHEKQIYSLPAIEVPTRELEASDVSELLDDALTAPVVVQLLNNQCHISFSSRAGERIIKEKAGVNGESAQHELGSVIERGINFREELIAHARKLAERAAKSAKPDKIVELIRTRWESSSKKLEFLQRLNLPASLADATSEEVETAYVSQRDAAEDWL